MSAELYEALRNWTALVELILEPEHGATARVERLYERLEKEGCNIRAMCPEGQGANQKEESK